VVEALGIQARLQDVLPGRAGNLAAAQVALSVEEAVQRRMERLLQEERMQALLLATVRETHERFVSILRGRSEVATISDGTLTLNLLPLIPDILSRLPGVGQVLADGRILDLGRRETQTEARRRLEAALGGALPANFGQITLLEAQALTTAQQALSVLDGLSWVLPLLFVACAALAVYLAPQRMRTGAILALGGAVGLLLLAVLLRILGPQVAQAAGSDPLTQVVAQSVQAALVSSLAGTAVVLSLIALAVGVGLLLLERSRRTPPAPAAEPAPGAEVATG
jgi:hypothetical protein